MLHWSSPWQRRAVSTRPLFCGTRARCARRPSLRWTRIIYLMTSFGINSDVTSIDAQAGRSGGIEAAGQQQAEGWRRRRQAATAQVGGGTGPGHVPRVLESTFTHLVVSKPESGDITRAASQNEADGLGAITARNMSKRHSFLPHLLLSPLLCGPRQSLRRPCPGERPPSCGPPQRCCCCCCRPSLWGNRYD